MAYPFPLPAGVANSNVAYFYANNTNSLGTFIKQVDDLSLITVDYTKLTPALTLKSISSFVANAGGNPPLVISNPTVDITDNILTFLLSNGLAGVQYTLSIIMQMSDNSIRTDKLVVNIPSTGNDLVANPAATPAFIFPSQGVVSADGSIYYNQVLRWFLSDTPPVNPNIMDQWYNPTSGVYSQYVTNGLVASWVINQSLLDPNVILQFNTLINSFFTGLPTTQPGTTGQLWWDGGVLSRT